MYYTPIKETLLHSTASHDGRRDITAVTLQRDLTDVTLQRDAPYRQMHVVTSETDARERAIAARQRT